MPNSAVVQSLSSLALTGAVVEALRLFDTRNALVSPVEAVTREMGFLYYALVHHDDLHQLRSNRVDLRDYPAIIIDHLIGQHDRRDPAIRACLFAGGAFLWSDLPRIIHPDRHDRISLERTARRV